jgi:hypothetical protein
MLNRAYRAYFLTSHADNIARSVFGDRVKGRGKAGFLRANCNAGAAFNTGTPIDRKYDGCFTGHRLTLLDFSKFRIRLEIFSQSLK